LTAGAIGATARSTRAAHAAAIGTATHSARACQIFHIWIQHFCLLWQCLITGNKKRGFMNVMYTKPRWPSSLYILSGLCFSGASALYMTSFQFYTAKPAKTESVLAERKAKSARC
jgi:hypothetical protein